MRTANQQNYVFEERVAEHTRLIEQSTLFDPLTERLLAAAGVGAGMGVLDLGTGAGNVALLAARMVGESGSVVSVDRDADALALAAAHAEREGIANVEFFEGDLAVPELPDGPFDAVVSRLVLMYLPEPAATLHAAALRLRPGGVVCCHEPAFHMGAAAPQPPLVQRIYTAITTTFRLTGADPHLGLRLHRVVADAGLPAPEMLGETVLACGPEAPMWAWGNIARGMAPVMERLGVDGAGEARSESLDERMLAELCEQDAVLMSPLMVGAWTRVPTV
ncbi:MAG TPA: methyltransferase domain-containing protein [Solirubrobacteraceae bacterium]|nr:methyltransferase domain-containing protein [Solirubrobacteraceae bacterium]